MSTYAALLIGIFSFGYTAVYGTILWFVDDPVSWHWLVANFTCCVLGGIGGYVLRSLWDETRKWK